MIDNPRPDSDDETIDLGELDTPSQAGSSGGDLQREIGSVDEEKTSTGSDPQPTSIHKGQQPRDGDEPSLPNRNQAGGQADKAPPRRS